MTSKDTLGFADSPFGDSADETEAWVTLKELQAGLGVSATTIKRMVSKGEIGKPRRNDEGEYVYPAPANYDAVKAQQSQEAASAAFLLSEAGKIIQAQSRHIERFVEITTGPVVEMMGHLHNQLAQMHKYTEQLQDRVLESVALREQMLSEEHARVLEQAKFEAQQRRLDQALEVGKDALTRYLTNAVPPGVNVRKLQAAERVLRALPLEDVKVMLTAEGEDSILPPEVREDARVLVEELEKEAIANGDKNNQ